MDCSTWFLVEKQSKMTYPLPPRFSAREVLSWVFVQVFSWGLLCRFAALDVEFYGIRGNLSGRHLLSNLTMQKVDIILKCMQRIDEVR